MWSLTRMDKAVIKDYCHMTTMDENVNWMKLTHLLSKIYTLGLPFCTSTFASKFLMLAFLNVRTRVNWYLSLMCTMYAKVSNNTPSYTYDSLHVAWRVQPRGPLCTNTSTLTNHTMSNHVGMIARVKYGKEKQEQSIAN